ncbi:uncharacterized protein LOC128286692 [Gossypium arboreum]|uniref:uncharacterized protein LOC128286692 n=1 Tax=Gossypium arboreum TaxID=29729 RepID=UPI0022F1B042|nr:uncharacterized protein LOC128286692 [Gossypium arboreum]
MEKKQSESFRQYAYRWREMVTQVQPYFLDNETTMLFINTVKALFINYILGSATKSFSDIVMSREMIENTVRSGKIDAGKMLKDHPQERRKMRALVQNLMDNKEFEFFEDVKDLEGEDVCTLEEGSMEKVNKVNHPILIISRLRNNEARTQAAPRVIIHKPVTFPYKDSKRVPWNYDCNVISQKRRAQWAPQKMARILVSTRIVGGAMALQVRESSPLKEKPCEYNVVEQLHKQPTRISILALLLSSETHCSALMNVLNNTYIANDISVNKLDRLVNNISADNFIFFNDDEIPPEGMGSTKALHINTRCKGYTLLGMLIDNGSALNVLPLSILNRLPVDRSHMKKCQNIVKAFDGTEKRVMGKIEIPVLIGPNTYEIHLARVVPSSLHQKLKLVTEGRLVMINAEKGIIALVTSDALYIEAGEEAIECSFRSLEFVNATFIVEGNKIPDTGQMRCKRRKAQLSEGEVKWEPMTFPHISKMFVSGRAIYLEQKMSEKESLEGKLGNLSINAIFEKGIGEENLLGICPYIPGSVLNKWTVEEIPVIFRTSLE